jgi:hypothetical protein
MMNIRTSFFMWSPPRDLNHLYVMKYVLTRHGRKYILRCIPVDAEIAGRQIPRLDSLFATAERRYRPDALPFEQFVPALDPPVRLRERTARYNVHHARGPNELLEVLGDELRPVG